MMNTKKLTRKDAKNIIAVLQQAESFECDSDARCEDGSCAIKFTMKDGYVIEGVGNTSSRNFVLHRAAGTPGSIHESNFTFLGALALEAFISNCIAEYFASKAEKSKQTDIENRNSFKNELLSRYSAKANA